MFDEFHLTLREIFRAAQREGRLIRNPDDDRLRELALEEPETRLTRYGNLAVSSEPTARVAAQTKNNVDASFGDEELQLLQQAKQRLAGEELVSVDLLLGDGSESISARLIVPRRFAHVVYAGQKLFRPAIAEDPTHQVLMFFDEQYEANRQKPLADKDVTVRLAYSSEGRVIKVIRNSNYIGEWKNGVFAGEDYRTRLKGDAIFLHSGCRKDTLETSHGPYKTSYSLFVGLNASLKNAITSRVLARKGRERSWVIQNDGGTLSRDGTFRGYESGAFYLKTDGLNPGELIETYYGALKPQTVLENVHVEQDGSLDFYNLEQATNGRAVIERRDLMHAGRHINAECIDYLFLLTRGSILPAIAKLTHEQAVAYMTLGLSMESPNGDNARAGALRTQFFYDPFAVGDRSEHANLFYEILRSNAHLQCFLLNTGWVGDGESLRDIRLGDTMGILDSLLRGGLEDWVRSDRTGLVVPRSVRTVDSILLRPEKLFAAGDFERRQRAMDAQRAEYLDQFPGLDPRVKAVFQR